MEEEEEKMRFKAGEISELENLNSVDVLFLATLRIKTCVNTSQL